MNMEGRLSVAEEKIAELQEAREQASARIAAVEAQQSATLLKILGALESSADGKVGLQETVRILSAEVKALTANVASLMKVVATHEEERQRAKGAWWATCLIAGGAGAIVGWLIAYSK